MNDQKTAYLEMPNHRNKIILPQRLPDVFILLHVHITHSIGCAIYLSDQLQLLLFL